MSDLTLQTRLLLALGAINASMAVAVSAAAAHLPAAQAMPMLATAATIQLVHGLGLVLIGTLALVLPRPHWMLRAGWLMAIGIALFSLNLYLRGFLDVQVFRALVPWGGTCLIASWLLLAVAVLVYRSERAR